MGLRGFTPRQGSVNMHSVGMQGVGPMRFQEGGSVPDVTELGSMPPTGPAAEEARPPIPGGLMADMATSPLEDPSDLRLMRIYEEVQLALKGQHPNPEKAVRLFLQTFGEAALKRVVEGFEVAQGEEARLVKGPGGEKDDQVPATINDVEEARLSDNEFVMTADAVRGAGEGDLEEGARRLTELNQTLSRQPQRGIKVERVS